MRKNIIFDFGGVLVDWNPDYVYQRHFGSPEHMQQFYEETGIFTVNRALDRGASFDHELEQLSLRFPHYREAIFLWRDEWVDMIRGTFADSIAIVTQLHQQGYPLYGLTNWSAETFPYALKNFPFLNCFNDIVVSGQIRAVKPETKIFQALLQRNDLDANDCIFIDDNLENVSAGQALGMAGIHFKTSQQLIDELRNHGIQIAK